MAVNARMDDIDGDLLAESIIPFPGLTVPPRTLHDYRRRRSISQRRRRLQRVRHAVEVAAWTGGSLALLVLAGAGVLSLR